MTEDTIRRLRELITDWKGHAMAAGQFSVDGDWDADHSRAATQAAVYSACADELKAMLYTEGARSIEISEIERLKGELELSEQAHYEVRAICAEVGVTAAFVDDAVRQVVERLKVAEKTALDTEGDRPAPQDGTKEPP